MIGSRDDCIPAWQLLPFTLLSSPNHRYGDKKIPSQLKSLLYLPKPEISGKRRKERRKKDLVFEVKDVIFVFPLSLFVYHHILCKTGVEIVMSDDKTAYRKKSNSNSFFKGSYCYEKGKKKSKFGMSLFEWELQITIAAQVYSIKRKWGTASNKHKQRTKENNPGFALNLRILSMTSSKIFS